MSDFGKRIAALEAKLGADPIILHSKDGSQRTIRGTVKHWFALTGAMSARHSARVAGEPQPTGPLADELEAIRDAVQIDEPAHTYNLLWAILNGPTSKEEQELMVQRRAEAVREELPASGGADGQH